MHAVIMFFVDAVIELFKLSAFTTTFCSERTVFAIGFTASVGAFGVAFTIGFFTFEKKLGLVAFGFSALVIVFLFIKSKTFPLGFILTEIRDISINVMVLAILQTLTTTVTGISKSLFDLHIILIKIFDSLIHYFRKYRTVFTSCRTGTSSRNNVVFVIYCQLTGIVQLTGFAYADGYIIEEIDAVNQCISIASR